MKYTIRSKIWIEDDNNNVIFGLGRLKILDAIQKTGSIHAAAKNLCMSYRAVWLKIKATEERIGRPLLIKNIGGNTRGGSKLTPLAEELLRLFRDLHRDIKNKSDDIFDRIFTSNIPSKLDL
ncbi:MAG: LysR family transcriptional regulator [Desulfobacterales bacterium]|nr:LysR family transcriptional regulator [Desulfobacterales bacterium]MBF0397079.1 LysR family transcriptional regulator [Desulfobacterales bacterium]